MTAISPNADSRVVSLTASAAERVSQLIEMEGRPELMLRLSIEGGGCSGFSYKFDLDDKTGEDDRVFEYHGVKFVIDEVSLDMVAGAEVDFVEDLVGSSFQVRNPNAASSCGCGSSFAV
ncbi:MAG: iron-sulfur cluster insertion protein ErpA [Rhodospirillales bacterium]|nr:iron-sulfur cluster insertion protein ErpA [Rhodospirillales bacterium]MCW8862670.1 iron-sulfur cluster insertion protein ErpA [Rhodospirillales bacterium]MCW8951755.1 iron-sulfur cluster insertion protein ErpA [Rhodospirillales bacterium]MCW8971602.1 iron-sulfur cluster insertion protein ErpA [Rhodospirillales bacterium]MCW9001488.1 iron-sulfur cluster insertion protein ErpA [Rhodospirillales bacterium]